MELRRKIPRPKAARDYKKLARAKDQRNLQGGASNTSAQESTRPANEGGPILSILYFYLLYFYYFTYISLTSPFQAPP